jgi:hypothetical protein
MSDISTQVQVTFDLPRRGGPAFRVTIQLPLGCKAATVHVADAHVPREEREAAKIARDWLQDRFQSWSLRS